MQSKLCDLVQVKLWDGWVFSEDEAEVDLPWRNQKNIAERLDNSNVSSVIRNSELIYSNFEALERIYAYRFISREKIIALNRYALQTFFEGRVIEETPWTYIGAEYTKDQVALERPDLIREMKGMTFERAVKINSGLFIFPKEKDFIVIPKLFER